MLQKNKSKYIKLAIIVFFLLGTIIIGKTVAILLENDIEVEVDTDLTYYLNVYYDGVDSEGNKSSDGTVVELESGNLYVEDKIPEGLTFEGFVTSNTGVFGAVKSDDDTVHCSGMVVDDTHEASNDTGVWNAGNTEYTYHGLHYNTNTRTVSFTVKNLQAGCVLTVGIITRTPDAVDDPDTVEVETRRDFYNYATVRENELTNNSNTVHTFMGAINVQMYNVTYQYEGDAPDNAPPVPLPSSYASGANVGVYAPVNLEGYTFSGWTSTDVTISNGSFTMPSSDVVIKGSFTPIESKKVTYSIQGTVPDGYIVPSEKDYYPGSDVVVDNLKQGDIFNGYSFLGWTSNDVTISNDNDFVMPNSNVSIVGSFEPRKYTVSYQFQGVNLPNNSDSLLPESQDYFPGTSVTLENPGSASGYNFLGWYYKSPFLMPEENVVIYGEWQRVAGYFAPTITKTITNSEDYYVEGDTVHFEIAVTNNAAYPIKNVILRENLSGATFIAGNGYTLKNESYVEIPTISAGGTVNVYADYVVGDELMDEFTNEVELLGALADNDYYLDTTNEYKATSDFTVANINLNIVNLNNINEVLSGSTFKLCRDILCTDEVGSGLSFTNLAPNTMYHLRQTRAATGYKLIADTDFYVDEDGEIYNPDGYTITNNNNQFTVQIVSNKINVLPKTGGPGTIGYTLIGLFIIIIVSVAFIVYKKELINIKIRRDL